MVTRRDFAKIVVLGGPLSATVAGALRAAAPAQRKIESTFNGVWLGSQSYSLRDRSLDDCIKGIASAGLGACELWSEHVEPKGLTSVINSRTADPKAKAEARESLRQWRLTTPSGVFADIRKKFDAAGVELIAYNYSFKDDFTDAEIERGFEMTKALGLELITSSATLAAAKRVVPFAEKHKMTVAYHGHDESWKPNEFSTPESFATAMAMSKRFKINLDIGHFFAAGFDPVPFIDANHENILVLHLKDRNRNQGTLGANIQGQVPPCSENSTVPCKGANVPWGQGATPIKEVLKLLRDKKYRIPALIEYEYRGTADSLTEVKKCFEYAKAALA